MSCARSHGDTRPDSHPPTAAAAAPAPAAKAAPPQARTEEACRQCQGQWGPHGMLGQLSCYCRTSDGGKICRSRADCEARCEIGFDESFGLEELRCGPKGCTGGTPG